jgi:hypothetical protein
LLARRGARSSKRPGTTGPSVDGVSSARHRSVLPGGCGGRRSTRGSARGTSAGRRDRRESARRSVGTVGRRESAGLGVCTATGALDDG